MPHPYRCSLCGGRKLRGDQFCDPCSRWTQRQRAGSAPEFKRASSPVEAVQGAGDGALHQAMFRHPSGRPKIADVTHFPCFLHHYPDRFECPGCLGNFELDREIAGYEL